MRIDPDNVALRGTREAIRTIASSRTAAFGVALFGIGLGVLGLFRNPFAGAIVLAAVFVAFSLVGVYGLILRNRFGGLYAIVDDVDVWEIKDATGQNATMTKTRTMRFLQDGVFAIRDYAWGKGDLRADYDCTPGHPADYFTYDGRQNVLVSLRETKRRGDIETYTIKRRCVGTFTESREWVQAEILHETKQLTMTVIFPPDRPPQRAWLSQRSRGQDWRENLVIDGTPSGQQRIEKILVEPRRGDAYTLSWDW